MIKTKLHSTFSKLITLDGSPTLISNEAQGVHEPMHNMKGAFSETIYVYERPLLQGLNYAESTFAVLSLGLGLGYNEILCAGVFLLHEKRTSTANFIKNVYLKSFEINRLLRESFLFWVQDKYSEFNSIYSEIAHLMALRYDIPEQEIKSLLGLWYDKGDWELCGKFPDELTQRDRFNVILYDAYSSRTHPEVWDEDFLDHFLRAHAMDQCSLGTYAAKGSLKRALLENQFHVEQPKGFGGKRSCTYATRKNRD